ncbi:hypothetical protein E4U19_005998 [Claviceps sp. Clav32 group G5]|nr:hypothetical protein E4U19_005998 [Claviceps sp. Clav32 group G5]KAG6044674.1 hypothetical protein E4U39_003091 [Claviceps sp. Clav50 group G5]
MATLVVKLGGAAITDKAKADTLSPNLDTLVDKVAKVYLTQLRPQGRAMVLIHGAGSFGHPPARRFQVKAGWGTAAAETDVDEGHDGTENERTQALTGQKEQERRDEVKFGMALTRQRVLQLHHHVLQRLQDRARLPVLSVSTYDTVETHHGQMTPESRTRLITRVRQLLAQGFIPLLFGDAVFDIAWGATILSGDALMHALATDMDSVQRCAFVTDVAGIYTRDPKIFDDATLIRQLRCSSADRDQSQGICEEPHLAASVVGHVDDVTGAMGSKWRWVQRIMAEAPHVCEVIICQVSDADRALAVAGGGNGGSGACGDEACTWTGIVR